MDAWGRTLQRRQGLALLLLLVGVTVTLVGGVRLGLLFVLVPMAAARSRG